MLTSTQFGQFNQNLHETYLETTTAIPGLPGFLLRSKKNPEVWSNWLNQAMVVGGLYLIFSLGCIIFFTQHAKQTRKNLKYIRSIQHQHAKEQERVKLAFDSAGLGVWELEVGQSILHADSSFYAMHNQEQKATLHMDTWLSMVHPNDRSTLKKLLLHAGLHGKSFECIYAIFPNKQTNTRYLQCKAKTHTNKRNGMTYIVGVNTDITVQKQYERALQEMEARFRTSFEWAAIGMAIISPKGPFLQVNHALCAMLDHQDQALLNMQASSIIHPDEISYHQKFLDDIFKMRCDNFYLEKRCQNAAGNTLWVFMSVAVVRKNNGKVLHFVVHIQDITERKRQEAKLLEREHFLRTLSECLPGLVSYWDTNLHCQFANQNHTKWIGIEAKQLRGQHLKNILGDNIFSLCQANIESALEGKRQRFEMHLVTQDHHEIDLLVHFIPDIVRREVNGFFAISTNISALKTQQRELEQINQTLTERTAQAEAASKAKGAFLANMSHEIRTPMNGIMGVLQLLEETSLSGQQQEYLGQIESAADVLLNVLNDILDLSRVEANKLELDIQRFDLESVLNKSMGLFNYRAQEKNIGLFCVKDLNCPSSLEGDPLRLAQVLNNLLSNAIKFTETGHIEVQVKCSPQQDMLEWQVKDTGIGMNEQQCQALFKPFSQVDDSATRRYGGAGLGLSICKSLIELMGGSIQVKSTPKQGSCFIFTTPNRNPIYTPSHTPAQSPKAGISTTNSTEQEPETLPLAGQTILVADDHKLNRLVASEMLKKWGASVVLAENGLEAVSACQQQPIHLVLMDLQMPEMDGFAATAAIIEQHGDKAPPIVAVTASTSERDRQAILEAGMAEHVTKPFKKERLKSILIALCPATTQINEN